jgi:sucrose-6-phosphate hydrolase SacC (GH32 family)
MFLSALVLMNPPTLQYSEAYRPQYHFTAPKGWINDPNGLVYFRGKYHLFYQHNPFGTEWGNMTWGHAMSTDLVHWQNLPNALTPDQLGTMFSGSAVVDWKNTSGLGSKTQPAMVMLYTAAGGTNEESKGQKFTQCLAYTTDGETFHKLATNPVLPHVEGENRDPKVLWHEPTKSWIMALYLDGDRFGIFRSSDLKNWTPAGKVTVTGSSECPDLFEIPVDGEAKVKKWVFSSASGRYLVGSFDGYEFKPEQESLPGAFGPNDYAAQTFSDEPKGRRVQISWMRGGKYPDMPFNQQMSVPRELHLIGSHGKMRLAALPVRELQLLRTNKVAFTKAESTAFGQPRSNLLEIRAKVSTKSPSKIRVGRLELRCEPGKLIVGNLGSADYVSERSEIDLIVYIDRTSIEVFMDRGLVQFAACYLPAETDLEIEVTGAKELAAWELTSAWEH